MNKAHRFSCEKSLVQEGEKQCLEQGWCYPVIQLSLWAPLDRVARLYLGISEVLSQGSNVYLIFIFLSQWR